MENKDELIRDLKLPVENKIIYTYINTHTCMHSTEKFRKMRKNV